MMENVCRVAASNVSNWDWFHLTEKFTNTCHSVHFWKESKRNILIIIFLFFCLFGDSAESIYWLNSCFSLVTLRPLRAVSEHYLKFLRGPCSELLTGVTPDFTNEVPLLSSIVYALFYIYVISKFISRIVVQFYLGNHHGPANPFHIIIIWWNSTKSISIHFLNRSTDRNYHNVEKATDKDIEKGKKMHHHMHGAINFCHASTQIFKLLKSNILSKAMDLLGQCKRITQL